jgi:1-phosphofructokinase/tagatose 6-phosphate kinase
VIQKTIVLPDLVENQVNRSNEYYNDASGKGVNVTRVLTQLGEKVVHLTQLGGRFRDYFLSMAEQDRLNIQWVESFSEIRSCYTLLNQSRKTSTEIVEEAVPVEKGTEQRILDLYHRLLPNCAGIIISGTKAAGFSDAIFPEMVRLAKQQGKFVILDYRGKDLLNSLPFQPDIIKPNYQEFITTFFPPESAASSGELDNLIKEKMLQIYREYKSATILTRGSREVLYVDEGAIQSIQPEKITPVNTIGCGDAFTAGVAASWLRGRELFAAIQNGLACAKWNALLLRPGVIL